MAKSQDNRSVIDSPVSSVTDEKSEGVMYTPEQLAAADEAGYQGKPDIFYSLPPAKQASELQSAKQSRESAKRKQGFAKAVGALGSIGDAIMDEVAKDVFKETIKAASRTKKQIEAAAKGEAGAKALTPVSIRSILVDQRETIKAKFRELADAAYNDAVAELDCACDGTDSLSKAAKEMLGDEYANATQSSTFIRAKGWTIGKKLAREYAQAAAMK